MTIIAITTLTAAAHGYADIRATLAERLQRRTDEIATVDRRLLPGIKSAAASAIEARGVLEDLLHTHCSEFDPPAKRTITAHGIKLGFQASKPAVEIESEALTIAAIEKHLPDQADTLIATKRSLVKAALANLDAKDLRRIGASLTPARDLVVIKSATDDLDKIIDALLKTTATAEESAA